MTASHHHPSTSKGVKDSFDISCHSPHTNGQATSAVEEAHLPQRVQRLENETAISKEMQQFTAEQIAALTAKLEQLERQQKSDKCLVM